MLEILKIDNSLRQEKGGDPIKNPNEILLLIFLEYYRTNVYEVKYMVIYLKIKL